MKMGDYPDSGPLWQGARSFHDLENITIVFSTKKGVRKPVSNIDTLKNVLSWTLLLVIPKRINRQIPDWRQTIGSVLKS